MLAPMATMVLWEAASRRASSSATIRGSANAWLTARICSRLLMFSGAETIAAIVGWPSVVLPTSTSLTRADEFATAWKYFSISSAPASLPSAPSAKPKYVSGAGTGCGDCPASAHDQRTIERRAARARTRHHSVTLSRPAATARTRRPPLWSASGFFEGALRGRPDGDRTCPIRPAPDDRIDV